MLFLRSLLFYLGQTISTLIFTPLSLLIYPLPFSTRYTVVSHWSVFNLWWLKVCCNIHAEIQGRDNISSRPGIVMCKHQSAWETLALQSLFVPQAWVLKRELLKIPIYGWGLASLNPIAIDRGSAIKSFRQIVDQGCERLNNNTWVVIFPEGTRVAPGQTKKYLPGGGLLAEKSGAMITPVAHNAGFIWPRNSFIKKPGKITMVIGSGIETTGKKAADITAEVQTWIENTVATLPDPEKCSD
ncbi:MAG: lysophospholipid acyltransferase family protein [Pseudomonadota bacterium]